MSGAYTWPRLLRRRTVRHALGVITLKVSLGMAIMFLAVTALGSIWNPFAPAEPAALSNQENPHG